MSSTRKSKKGFKRLENHELADFTSHASMGNGALGESGSENDLLDLTNVEERDPQGRCYSCCGCCTLFYFVVLTFVVLLLGVYSGYLTINLWQMSESTTDTHISLEARLNSMEDGLKSYKADMRNKYSTLHRDISDLREALNRTQESLKSFMHSMGDSLNKVDINVNDLDTRLKIAESKPQEMLIREVDTINRDMGVLNASMRQLNASLADIDLVKKRIAEVGVGIDRYDEQLRQLKNSMADVHQENSEMKETVDAAVNGVVKFKSKLETVSTSVSATHNQIQQTTDLLSAQVTDVQLIVTKLNETMEGEMDSMRSNVSQVQSSVENLSTEVVTLSEAFLGLLNQPPGIPSSQVPEDVHTAPPVTLPPPTKPPVTESGTEPSMATQGQAANTDDDMLTPNEPSGGPTTPGTESTESQSTSATEDKPGIRLNGTDIESNIETTMTVENGTTQMPVDDMEDTTVQSSNFDTEDKEIEINSTQSAIHLLQSLADNFSRLDVDDDGQLSLEEFIVEIPKPFIFSLLDSNHNQYLTYEELLFSIGNLRDKLAELTRVEEPWDSTPKPDTGRDGVVDKGEDFDPDMKQKLKELYDYIMSNGHN